MLWKHSFKKAGKIVVMKICPFGLEQDNSEECVEF